MGNLTRWMLLAVLVSSACATKTPAPSDPSPSAAQRSAAQRSAAQRAQKKCNNATMGCWFRHGYEEAKAGAPLVTDAKTGTGNSAADVAFRACLQKAKADLNRELAEANASQ